jgi:uncharacterized RDD family membrane protein YckC/cytoskeletal protein CcmA (bactofilin family)
MKPAREWIQLARWSLAGTILLFGLTPGWMAAQAVDTAELIEAEQSVMSESDAPSAPIRRIGRAPANPREILQLGGKVEIAEGEEVQDAVVIFGDAHVRGTVRGDLVVVFGRATVEGEVRGSLVAPFSAVTLGPGSRVGGDVVAVLGGLEMDPMASIAGQRIDFSITSLEDRLPALEGGKAWLTQGLLLVRPLPHQAGWWWWVALGCAVLYFLTALIFPRPVAVSVNVLETQPVAACFLGLLVLVLVGPLLLMLAATGIGLIVVPFVVAALMAAFLLGKIAVAQYLGREMGRQVGLKLLTIPLVALFAGITVLYLIYMVPGIGLLAWALTGLLGVGVAAIALFRAFGRETQTSPLPVIACGSGPEQKVPVVTPVHVTVDPPITPAPTAAPGREPELETIGDQGFEAPPRIPGQKPVLDWLEATALPRVGFWARLGATMIDLILIGVLVGLLHRVSWFIPIWLGYHVAMWAWRGTTIGGIVFGLRIAKVDGHPIDFPIALIRALSSFLSAVALFMGFFWAGWSREKRAWHDLIAGTMIVRMPKGKSPL